MLSPFECVECPLTDASDALNELTCLSCWGRGGRASDPPGERVLCMDLCFRSVRIPCNTEAGFSSGIKFPAVTLSSGRSPRGLETNESDDCDMLFLIERCTGVSPRVVKVPIRVWFEDIEDFAVCEPGVAER